jgi:hypothetical protein
LKITDYFSKYAKDNICIQNLLQYIIPPSVSDMATENKWKFTISNSFFGVKTSEYIYGKISMELAEKHGILNNNFDKFDQKCILTIKEIPITITFYLTQQKK